MCRWIAYQGEPTFLDVLVAEPAHSLIAQSLCASETKVVTNGDGFGIGWYGERPEPGLESTPGTDSGGIDGLPRLPLARCPDRSLIVLRMQAGIVPGQSADLDQASDLWLRILDQLLVVDLDEAVRRQHTTPMGRELFNRPNHRHQ